MESIEKLRDFLKGTPLWRAVDFRLADIEREIAERYTEWPVDADGVPVHVDDVTTHGIVKALHFDGKLWSFSNENDVISFAKYTTHVKPRTVEGVMSEYAELSASQDVKKYHEVSDELREIQREQFQDEPERELFKNFNGYEFYIELPYDELCIGTEHSWIDHHSYSYMYKRPDGTTVHSCVSLCGYSRDWVIKRIDEEIARIESELQEQGDEE